MDNVEKVIPDPEQKDKETKGEKSWILTILQKIKNHRINYTLLGIIASALTLLYSLEKPIIDSINSAEKILERTRLEGSYIPSDSEKNFSFDSTPIKAFEKFLGNDLSFKLNYVSGIF